MNYVVVKREDYYWYSVRTQLRDYVRQPAVMLFLKAYGYHDRMSIMEMLEHLRYRMEVALSFHMKSAFLGYPLKDVKCFISYRGGDTEECAESGRFTMM